MNQLIISALNAISFSSLINGGRITGRNLITITIVLVATDISLVQAIYTLLVFLPSPAGDKADRKC